MKRGLLALVVLTTLFGQPCLAQSTQPGDESKPASSNVPGAEYPRIHSDLRVTFRLKAPTHRKCDCTWTRTMTLFAIPMASGA